MTSNKDHYRAMWELRRSVRLLARETKDKVLMWRDQKAVMRALARGDMDAYAFARMAYWRRWGR